MNFKNNLKSRNCYFYWLKDSRVLLKQWRYKLLLPMLCCIVPAVKAQVLPLNTFEEYQIKASYISHIIKYARWPDDIAPSSERPLELCVLGVDPFGGDLDKIINSKTVGHSINVTRYRQVGSVATCHVLYISHSESQRVNAILQHVQDIPVLTISDIKTFSKQGGSVGFINQSNKVKLHVNLTASRRVGVKLDSFLIEVATQVYD